MPSRMSSKVLRSIKLIISAVGCLVCLLFAVSCERSCPSTPIDKSTAGLIASRNRLPCRCFVDGKELQPSYETGWYVSKDGNSCLKLDVYGEAEELPECFPKKGEWWEVHVSPFLVKGNNKSVSFNDSTALKLTSVYEDGTEMSINARAKIQGWIINDPIPVTRSEDEYALQFDVYIDWDREGESHEIYLTDVFPRE